MRIQQSTVRTETLSDRNKTIIGILVGSRSSGIEVDNRHSERSHERERGKKKRERGGRAGARKYAVIS